MSVGEGLGCALGTFSQVQRPQNLASKRLSSLASGKEPFNLNFSFSLHGVKPEGNGAPLLSYLKEPPSDKT